MLPNGATYTSVKVSPKPSVAPVFQQQGSMVAWTGLSIQAKKTSTFRVKLAFDKCAGDDAVPPKRASGKPTGLFNATVGVSTFTGPVDNQACVVIQHTKVSKAGNGTVWEGCVC
jgi:hypothetical protein